VEDLRIETRYGLIFIPSGSFGLITDLNAAKAALKNLYDHLSDDGILVFEAETIHAASKHIGIWRGSAWPREDGQIILANFLDLPFADIICSTICKYELISENHVSTTEFETLKIRLYGPKDLIAMLHSVGFKNVRMIKAFDESAIPDELDEVIVYECKK
jgi:hypothetical protein